MLLNIGLARNDGKPDNRVDEVLALLGDDVVETSRVHVSDTEKTLVVKTARPLSATSLWLLCERTAQDCVAFFSVNGGELIGPKAAAWGPFNPAYFLTLDGNRLN